LLWIFTWRIYPFLTRDLAPSWEREKGRRFLPESFLITPSYEQLSSGLPGLFFLWYCLKLLLCSIQWHFHGQASSILLLAGTYIYPSYSLPLHPGPLPVTVHFIQKMGAEMSSETLDTYSNSTRRHNTEDRDLFVIPC